MNYLRAVTRAGPLPPREGVAGTEGWAFAEGEVSTPPVRTCPAPDRCWSPIPPPEAIRRATAGRNAAPDVCDGALSVTERGVAHRIPDSGNAVGGHGGPVSRTRPVAMGRRARTRWRSRDAEAVWRAAAAGAGARADVLRDRPRTERTRRPCGTPGRPVMVESGPTEGDKSSSPLLAAEAGLLHAVAFDVGRSPLPARPARRDRAGQSSRRGVGRPRAPALVAGHPCGGSLKASWDDVAAPDGACGHERGHDDAAGGQGWCRTRGRWERPLGRKDTAELGDDGPTGPRRANVPRGGQAGADNDEHAGVLARPHTSRITDRPVTRRSRTSRRSPSCRGEGLPRAAQGHGRHHPLRPDQARRGEVSHRLAP